MNPVNNNYIVYQFSRMKIERGDFSHFVNLYESRIYDRLRLVFEYFNMPFDAHAVSRPSP